MCSGASGLALALVLGPRLGFRKDSMRPHNLPLVLLGAGLLWFGWFGFNAGSALGANGLAAAAFLNTQTAGCAGLLGWLFVGEAPGRARHDAGRRVRRRSPAWSRSPRRAAASTLLGALVVGLAAGVLCSYAVSWKFRWGVDDSLDVVGVHLVGGIVGTLLIGAASPPTSMTGGPRGPALRRRARASWAGRRSRSRRSGRTPSP